MGEVTYIDSSGIATLVEGLQLSRETKTHFGLLALRHNARSVLELARLNKVFAIFAPSRKHWKKSRPPFLSGDCEESVAADSGLHGCECKISSSALKRSPLQRQVPPGRT